MTKAELQKTIDELNADNNESQCWEELWND